MRNSGKKRKPIIVTVIFIARKRLWRPFGNTSDAEIPIEAVAMASAALQCVGGACQRYFVVLFSGGVMCLGYFLVGQKPKGEQVK